jgi:hypothetical protein
MPKTRERMTIAEAKENRTRLQRLREIGIVTGAAGDLSAKPHRFRLQQTDSDFGRVYTWPNGGVVAVVFARLTVLESGVMITDSQMIGQWDEFPLDLSDVREHRLFSEIAPDIPHQASILNDLLVGRPTPLRLCQPEGAVIAIGWTDKLRAYRDQTFLTMELQLMDERDYETHWRFEGRLDRTFEHKYERHLERTHQITRVQQRGGLYGDRIGSSSRPPASSNVGPLVAASGVRGTLNADSED